jgi:hypothetical protein
MSALHQSILNLEQYIAGTFKPLAGNEQNGLCCNVIHGDLCVYRHFESWEHFSGRYLYPVEGTADEYIDNLRKNDRRTKYGKLRLDLAKHLLKELKKELA